MVQFNTVLTNSPVFTGLCCLVIKSHATSVHHLLLLQEEIQFITRVLKHSALSALIYDF